MDRLESEEKWKRNRRRRGEGRREGYIFLRFYFGIEIREEIETKEKKMGRKMSKEVFVR